MSFDPSLQRRIFGQFATGVTVITTKFGEELHGMTANAVTSLSLSPPLALVAVDRQAHMHEQLRRAGAFAINILRADQESLSQRFAKRGPKEFGDLAFTPGPHSGAAVFADVLAWVDCRLAETLPGGDHDIFVGEIVAGECVGGAPLLYFAGKYAKLADV